MIELNYFKRPSLKGPYNRFIYALKAPESQRQYPRRLDVFLNFIGIDDSNLQEMLVKAKIEGNKIIIEKE